jgi:hypothetical protein
MNFRPIIQRFSGALFCVVSILHLLRIITGVPILIDGWLLPIWVNWAGMFGAAGIGLALLSFSGPVASVRHKRHLRTDSIQERTKTGKK